MTPLAFLKLALEQQLMEDFEPVLENEEALPHNVPLTPEQLQEHTQVRAYYIYLDRVNNWHDDKPHAKDDWLQAEQQEADAVRQGHG